MYKPDGLGMVFHKSDIGMVFDSYDNGSELEL